MQGKIETSRLFYQAEENGRERAYVKDGDI